MKTEVFLTASVLKKAHVDGSRMRRGLPENCCRVIALGEEGKVDAPREVMFPVQRCRRTNVEKSTEAHNGFWRCISIHRHWFGGGIPYIEHNLQKLGKLIAKTTLDGPKCCCCAPNICVPSVMRRTEASSKALAAPGRILRENASQR